MNGTTPATEVTGAEVGTSPDSTSEPMTSKDRDRLAGLARKRAKVAKSMVGERVKVLRSEVENDLSAQYAFDDQLWAEVNEHARAAVAAADAQVAEICRSLGIPDEMRPSLSVSWAGRGENAAASRRTELRKLAHARIDAAAESAKVAIESSLLDVETELVRDGLDTSTAVAYLESMPSVEALMPAVDVGELDAPPVERRFGWQPPAGAAGALLTPASATGRKAKQDAIVRALAVMPEASNRAVAERVGVDHKTVARVRGELPHSDGETPQDGAE